MQFTMRLNVALMGGKEQLISFTAFNGDDIEAVYLLMSNSDKE